MLKASRLFESDSACEPMGTMGDDQGGAIRQTQNNTKRAIVPGKERSRES
jgi:hypothetical protein